MWKILTHVKVLDSGKLQYRHYKGHWQDINAAEKASMGGLTEADNVRILLPVEENSRFIGQDIEIGDYLVKGDVNPEPETLRELLKWYSAKKVTRIIDADFGSHNLQHVEIGAK
ncbi:MAG: hypothetical protein Q4Q17_01140 [Tissierellia bacterium]|nr:hypothetical protein [Tissierellia bacterium]